MPIESEVLGKRSPCSSRRVWRGALVSQQPFCLVSHWHWPPHTHTLCSAWCICSCRGGALRMTDPKGLLLFPLKKAFPGPGNTWISKLSQSLLHNYRVLTWIWKLFAPLSTTGKSNQDLSIFPKGNHFEEEETASHHPDSLRRAVLRPLAFTQGARSHVCPHCKNKPNKLKLDLRVEITRGSLCLPWRISVKGLHRRIWEFSVSPRCDQNQGNPWSPVPCSLPAPKFKPQKPQLWPQTGGPGVSYLQSNLHKGILFQFFRKITLAHLRG